MASMLQRIEAIMKDMVAKPITDTLAKLDKLAASDRDHPGPHVAKAFVAGFARYDYGDSLKYLAEGKKRLGGRRVELRADPEMAFARALHDVLEAEAQSRVKALDRSGNARELVGLERTSLKAQKLLASAVRRFRGPGSGLAKTVLAALQAFSMGNSTQGAGYRAGLNALKRLRREDTVGNLASFFLLYAHRRARDYAGAIRVGKALERSVPNSAMLKRAIGSSYYFGGDVNRAIDYYRQALSMTPKDASLMLDLSRALSRSGAADEAKAMIEKASRLGSTTNMARFHRAALHTLNISAIAPHRFVRFLDQPD